MGSLICDLIGHKWWKQFDPQSKFLKICTRCMKPVVKAEFDVISGQPFILDGYYRVEHVDEDENKNCIISNIEKRGIFCLKKTKSWYGSGCGHPMRFKLLREYK